MQKISKSNELAILSFLRLTATPPPTPWCYSQSSICYFVFNILIKPRRGQAMMHFQIDYRILSSPGISGMQHSILSTFEKFQSLFTRSQFEPWGNGMFWPLKSLCSPLSDSKSAYKLGSHVFLLPLKGSTRHNLPIWISLCDVL